MIAIRTYEFEHDGKTYQCRASPTGTGWLVQVLIDGEPANWLSYTVTFETAADASHSPVLREPVEHLMRCAEEDVRQGLIYSHVARPRPAGP